MEWHFMVTIILCGWRRPFYVSDGLWTYICCINGWVRLVSCLVSCLSCMIGTGRQLSYPSRLRRCQRPWSRDTSPGPSAAGPHPSSAPRDV